MFALNRNRTRRVLRNAPVIQAVLAACVSNSIGCGPPPIKLDDVNRIRVCRTDYLEVREMFGKPSRVGRTGRLVLWTYEQPMGAGWLLVAFRNDIVVDYAYNAPGIIE